MRTVWFVLPFTVGPLLGEGLGDASPAVQTTGLVLAWALWGIGLVATLIFHPAGLVALRSATPLAVAAALWSWVHRSPSAATTALGLGSAVVASVVMHSAETGHLAVNGPAYPNERRFLLRPPAVLLVGPIPLAGTVLAVGAVAGPLLLAARHWIAGAFALGEGDRAGFGAICVLSGLALGADLALPPAMLADALRSAGHEARAGAYFGLWTFATKLNLALAAGLALPLLAYFGYAPGTPDTARPLAYAYCLLPCMLKLAAAGALWAGIGFRQSPAGDTP